jgi:hypothetical protein
MVTVNCWVDNNGYYVCELKGKVCPSTYLWSITDFHFNVPPGYDLDQASMRIYVTTYLAQGSCSRNFNLTLVMCANQPDCPWFSCTYKIETPFEVGREIQSETDIPPGKMKGCMQYGGNTIRFLSSPLGGLCFPWGVVCADIDAYVYFPPLPSVPPSPSPSPTPPINYLPYVILLALILGGGSAVIAYLAKPRAPLVQVVSGKT